jgi:hypothetical protein
VGCPKASFSVVTKTFATECMCWGSCRLRGAGQAELWDLLQVQAWQCKPCCLIAEHRALLDMRKVLDPAGSALASWSADTCQCDGSWTAVFCYDVNSDRSGRVETLYAHPRL